MEQQPNIIASFSGEYHFLSNFYPCKVEYEGILYPTSEHAFQAAKTLNTYRRWHISLLMTPGKAKRAGRELVLRPFWDDIKLQVMEQILRTKFSNPEMKQLLLDTGAKILVEGNSWNDTFWGVCTKTGRGENNLGNLLMKIRGDLRGSVV
jgi:ribA/ribD-fused uncharacterized protein